MLTPQIAQMPKAELRQLVWQLEKTNKCIQCMKYCHYPDFVVNQNKMNIFAQ